MRHVEASQRVGRNARILLIVTGRSDDELAATLHLNVRRLREKLRGSRGWRLDELDELAHYFGVPVDDLLQEPATQLRMQPTTWKGPTDE